jgi:putative endonuclease
VEGSQLGRTGEGQAALYLKSKGWIVLARNYRLKCGEIDIVAQDPKRTLVFVEVKALSKTYQDGWVPEDSFSGWKLHKLQKVCTMFVDKHLHLLEERRGWRIDLISITFLGSKRAVLRHYMNIF